MGDKDLEVSLVKSDSDDKSPSPEDENVDDETPGNSQDKIEDDDQNSFTNIDLRNTDKENRKTKFSFKTISRQKQILLGCMAFANFGSAACFAILAPFFPGKAREKGTSDFLTGLIFSLHEFVIFATAPVFGNFLMILGAKRTFVTGILVCGVSSVIFGVLDHAPYGTPFIALCFVTRIIEAIGASAFVTASFAIIAHDFPGHEATIFGALEAFNGLGMMVGPPLGGALYLAGGYGLPFWVLGGMLLACGTFSIYFMPVHNYAGHPYVGSLFTLFKSPQILVIGYSILTAYFSIGFLDPTLANHYAKFKLTPLIIGLLFLIAPSLYSCEAPVIGWLSDKKGHSKSIMIVGHTLIIFAFLLLGPAPFLPFIPFELWTQILALIAIGILLGFIIIPTFKEALRGAKYLGMPDDFNTFGIVSGFINSAMSLGASIGSILGGAMVGSTRFDWAASVVALLYLISSIVLVIFAVINKYYIKPNRKVNYDSLHDAVQLQDITRNQQAVDVMCR